MNHASVGRRVWAPPREERAQTPRSSTELCSTEPACTRKPSTRNFSGVKGVTLWSWSSKLEAGGAMKQLSSWTACPQRERVKHHHSSTGLLSWRGSKGGPGYWPYRVAELTRVLWSHCALMILRALRALCPPSLTCKRDFSRISD